MFAVRTRMAKPLVRFFVQDSNLLNQHKPMKSLKLLAVALLLSAGAYAQNPPLPPTVVTPPAPGQHLRDMTPEQRAALKAQRKAELEKMTPDERKAFRTEHRANREAKLNAMPADKRERVEAKITERKRTRKTERKQEKS